MVVNLQTREHRELLKYTKDRVVDIETTSSGESSSSDEEALKPL